MALLLVMACGSTAPSPGIGSAVDSTSGGGAADVDTSGAPGSGSRPVQGGVPGGPLDDDGSITPQIDSGGRDAVGAPGTGRSAGGGVSVASRAPIKVGITYIDENEFNAYTNQFSSDGGLRLGDNQAMFRDLIDDVNKKGGVLRRKIEPVWFQAHTTDNYDVQAQAACAHFTQDNRIFATFDPVSTPGYYHCLAKAGVAIVNSNWTEMLSSDYRRSPLILQPASISLDRLARIEARELVRMKFFEPGYKLGILHLDSPNFVAGARALEASLRSHGIRTARNDPIHDADSLQDQSATQAEVQNAVLRFRSEGISRVLCVETNAFICGFFALYANRQNYYPRFGLTSDQPLTNFSGLDPESLRGTVFVGWWPPQDMKDPQDMPLATRQCFAFMNARGHATTSGNERLQATAACNSVAYFVAALKAGGEVSAQGLLRGAHALGVPDFAPSATFAVDTRPDRHDGVAAVRDGAWIDACACFKYTTPLIPV